MLAPTCSRSSTGWHKKTCRFRGSATARWGDGDAGGAPAPDDGKWSTAALGGRLAAAVTRGLVVLTLDYALRPEQVATARRNAARFGCVPFVTQTPLDRLPEAPPSAMASVPTAPTR